MILYVQGRFVPEEEARISVLDRGFLYGDSIYETVRARRGRVLFWRDHETRLERSASLLGIEIEAERPDILSVLRELLRRNALDGARLRIIVTRGVGDRDQLAGFTPAWVVLCEAFEPLPEDRYEKGIAAVLVRVVRQAVASLNPEIKSCNLLNNHLARREALARGAAEGVMTNAQGFLAEGAFSNLFWVTADGALRTPSLAMGILPGVTRQKVLALARTEGIPAEEVAASPGELRGAREIFLTSTSWEVLSVTSWNGERVGAGRQGEAARMLRAALRRLYDAPGESA